jgi:SAM-dependent methyltransferase
MWHYVAPEAFFVCASADESLPFADGAFDGVLCSDAFHCFLNRAASVREMRRMLSPEGTLVLARFGNAAVEPREGYELVVEQYKRLFDGIGHVALGEDALVKAYSERKSADLQHEAPLENLARQKWISVVASRQPAVFRPSEAFGAWPHAVGRLQLNPIYRVERRESNGDLSLRFEFPSEWYKFENEAYLAYAPKEVRLPARLSRDLAASANDMELDRYIGQFVVIGMPDRYVARAAG